MRAVGAALAPVLLAPAALRANNVSTATGPGGYWSSTGTWVSNTVPASGIDTELDFGGTGADANTFTDDIGAGTFTLNEIQLSSTSTGTQTIAANASGNTLTFVSNSLLTAPQILQNGSGAYVINIGLVLNNTLTLGGSGSGALGLTGTISGTGGLTLNGPYTVTLSGQNTFSGNITINAGVLDVNVAGSLPASSNLTFNGTGSFILENSGAHTSHGQHLSAIAFSGGDATVEVDDNVGQVIALIPEQQLSQRSVGATGNFVVRGTAKPSQAEIAPIYMSAGFIDQGTYYNGSNYAWVDGNSSVLRGIAYGTVQSHALTDPGAFTFSGGSTVTPIALAVSYAQTTGPISGQPTATLTTLNLASNDTFSLAGSATLTIKGILKSGNSSAGAAMITGGIGIQGVGGAELVIRTDGPNDALTVNTPVLNNGGNALTKSGLGTLTFGGANAYTGMTTLNAGTTIFAASAGSSGSGSLEVGGNAGIATLEIETTGTVIFNSVSVGGVPGSVSSSSGGGAIVQTSGTFIYSAGSGSGLSLGTGTTGGGTALPSAGYGAYTLSGGTLASNGGSGAVLIGAGGLPNSGPGLGSFAQTGGSFVLGGQWTIGGNGIGVATLTGGTTTGATASGVYLGLGGPGTLNMGTLAGGDATLVGQSAAGVQLGSAGLLNLNAGTFALTGGTIHKISASAVVNWNGATLQAGASGLTLIDNTVNAVNVYNGGAVVDTQGFNATIAAPLIGAVGNGIYPSVGTLNLPTAGSGYIGAPLVTVSGGSGSGATAIANVVNGAITGVTLTSPGQNYQSGDVLTFTFAGGGAATPAPAAQCTLQLPDVSLNGMGGFKKLGSGTLVLTGASTYTGATSVMAGTLQVDGSLADTPVSVAAGATLAGRGAIGNAGPNAVTVAGTVAPGDPATIATLATGPMTWAAGGAYRWKVSQLPGGSAGPGTGWDDLIVSSLSVTALSTPGSQFTIAPTGSPAGIQLGSTYRWPIAQIGPAGGPVGGFDPAKFVLDTSQFAAGAYPASDFSIANTGNEVDVVFTRAPEPSSLMLIGMAAGAGVMRRRRRH